MKGFENITISFYMLSRNNSVTDVLVAGNLPHDTLCSTLLFQ